VEVSVRYFLVHGGSFFSKCLAHFSHDDFGRFPQMPHKCFILQATEIAKAEGLLKKDKKADRGKSKEELKEEEEAVIRYVVPSLKVPKRENFSLSFFALREPIWVRDLGTGEKNRIFYQLTPDFDGF
jgi:hypothetical protein